MKASKRFLALLLALILCIGASVTSMAADESDGYTCEVNPNYMMGKWSGTYDNNASTSGIFGGGSALGRIVAGCSLTFDRFDPYLISTRTNAVGAWHVSGGTVTVSFGNPLLQAAITKFDSKYTDGLITKEISEGWLWVDASTGQVVSYDFGDSSADTSGTGSNAFDFTFSLSCKSHSLDIVLKPSELLLYKAGTAATLLSGMSINITAKQETKSSGHYATYTHPETQSTYTRKGMNKHVCCRICNEDITSLSFKKLKTIEAPTLKSCAMSSTGIALSWSKPTGATAYEVLRGTSSSTGKMSVIATVTKTSYTDTTAVTGTTYYYAIKAAARLDGTIVNRSAASNTASMKAIMAPTNVKATSISTGIQVSWSSASNATGYILYRKKGSGSWTKYATIKSGKTSSYLDDDLTSGTTYSYKVYTYYQSTSSKSPASKIVTKCFLKKPTIKSLSSTTSKKLKVTWTRDSKADGYQVMFSRNSDMSSSTTVTYTGSSSTATKTLSSLKSGKKYYVKIRAYKTIDKVTYYSVWSSVKNITVK